MNFLNVIETLRFCNKNLYCLELGKKRLSFNDEHIYAVYKYIFIDCENEARIIEGV